MFEPVRCCAAIFLVLGAAVLFDDSIWPLARLALRVAQAATGQNAPRQAMVPRAHSGHRSVQQLQI
jgi:hypothetical protein